MKGGIKKLVNYCREKEKGLREDQLETIGAREIATYHVETEIENKMVLSTYLDLDTIKKQQELWESSLNNTIKTIDNDKATDRFLCMHLPYYRNDRFFPVPNVELIRKFNPEKIITLFDDAHVCLQRIRKRPETRSIFSLRDMFLWRMVSVYVGDNLAQSLSNNNKIQNFIVAVKHPVTTLSRLIYHPEILSLYSAFSITHIRTDDKKKSKVNNFRKKLHEQFCVYDPLAIDDRVCQLKFDEWKKNGGTNVDDEITITEKDRWELGQDFSLVGETLQVDENESIYPIKIRVVEIQEVSEAKISGSNKNPSVIDNTIRARDFRLIDQSDTMVQYRPNISGKVSEGMLHEANYASQVNPKEWFFYWPDEDGDISSVPFSAYIGKAVQYKDENDLLKRLKEKEKTIKKN